MANNAGKKYAVNMTEGAIWKLLVLFAVPMLLGNLFQELYNTVDSIVIGNFVGKEGLAAVGATTVVCNTLVRFFNGVSMGASVVISHAFGAKDKEQIHRSVETTMAIGVAVGILVSAIAVPLSPRMLQMISTPDDVFGPATEYLQIYAFGVVFLFIYNMGSSVLRAVGDTRRPLYYLIITSLVNIVLDIVFVANFHMGIAGTAWATIFSEAVSAVMVCAALVRSREVYALSIRDLRIHPKIAKEIFLIGLPAALQQGLTSFSNAFVQKYVNSFDSSVMAGWSCHTKIDGFTLLPVQSMGQAATTFVGQNLGAEKPERAREGVRTALMMGIGFMISICVVMFFTASKLVGLFSREPDVLYYGTQFVVMMLPFRFCSAINQILGGALRGAGDSKAPMLIMMFSFIVCRQTYLFVITRFVRTTLSVGLGYPLGWVVCSIIISIYYRRKSGARFFDK